MALSNKLAKTIKDSSFGQEFIQHLKHNILSLDTLQDIDFLDKEKAAIEGRARELARDKLILIYAPLVNAQDPDIIKDKRDSFVVDVDLEE